MTYPVKNTPPSNDLRGVDVTAPLSRRERDNEYKGVVVQLAHHWRVIICKNGIQFILQRKEASHAGPWRGMSYQNTRDGLLRACGSAGPLKSGALEMLEALPDYASRLAKK